MKKNETKELYSVGQICEKTGITRKTLFYYDRNGLLTPTERSGPQQFKFYDEEKLARLKLIITYREAGLSIAEIREILDDQKSDRLKVLKGALNRLLQERDETDQEIKKNISIQNEVVTQLENFRLGISLCIDLCKQTV
jgi:DNA-binding transcriptional MerR regulator